ncbi:S8 family serine peptidase [Georgenia faecalis]|uniref:S8 family serine peptidase n=1 Tax=Georgenia faecalis TaxID=2483799 RepID=UPI000FD79769|nr:S8 family serine peptidase [Georgenia faecalis]
MRRTARRLGAAAAALGVLLPLAGLAGTPATPATAGVPVPTAARPAVDAVGDADSSQTCDQEGGYAISSRPVALDGYDASRLWSRAAGRGVRVAVVDSGINVANPHFTTEGPTGPAYEVGTSLLPASLAEEYVNAYDPRGWADPSGHGTAVAGIIAARPVEDSTSEVVGLAPYATIVPVQVFGAVVETTEDSVDLLPDTGRLAAGIRWAADAGVQVIAVSMSVLDPDPRLEEAVAYAVGKGILVVASAGSFETAAEGDPGGVHYPAGFPGVLGVTAVDVFGQPSARNFTGEHVDVAAPGQQVATAYRGLLDCYLGEEPAPSYAVPYVAATAALLAEEFPDEGAEMWAHRIMMSAERPQQAVRDDAVGWGALAPYDALTMTVDPDRPGPAVPGHPPVKDVSEATAPPVASPPVDPWAPARDSGLLLAVGGVALVAVLAMVRTLGRGTHRGRIEVPG